MAKNKNPLGSERNPIKVKMPQGERAYLGRLRCADGVAPAYDRDGSTLGRDGHMVDIYTVTCTGSEPVMIIMDMYHSDKEDQAVPGFTIVPRG